MSYLSRLSLNTARRETRALLAAPQRMHAAVLGCFPPGTVTADGDARVLWRMDRPIDHRQATLFVVSPRPPSMEHLVEQAGWETAPAETRDYERLLRRLAPGQHWAFRLTANPVRHVRKAPEQARTRPQAHVTVHHQLGWLMERAAGAGFTVAKETDDQPDARLSERRTWHFDRLGSQVTLATATFNGVLVVENAESVRRTLTQGLGRARAYGCGLLTVAPLTRGDRQEDA